MIDTVTELYYLLRVSRIRSDGLVFRLHALTTILMLLFSVIISSKQTVGNPIECVHTRDIPVEAFNAYCWIHSTYIVSGAMLGVAGANVAYPGVASSFGILQTRYQDEDYRHVNDQTKRVKYYQWVAFVLIFQRVGGTL
ncbi:innexin shaking-B-like [Vespula pensylvanica]|uniref:innexin shaking-B-like n=1 Tax=Vespula pensylvanica TaxID=30213 RepID=UPI001CB9DDDC|nr:innexin shaking-B-like [Vespula pensylvanica]